MFVPQLIPSWALLSKGEAGRQDLSSEDLFTSHPDPHATPLCLLMKSTLIQRKVNLYLRLVETRGEDDPRGTDEFRSLDKLCADFV